LFESVFCLRTSHVTDPTQQLVYDAQQPTLPLDATGAQIHEMVARLRARAAQLPASAAEPAKPGERVGEPMSVFPEAVAAMPQDVARLALFGMPSNKKGARKMLRNVKLESRADVDAHYTGEEMGPREETVWLACLRLCRGRPMGQRVHLQIADLLREIGQPDTGGVAGSRAALKRRLDRLSLAHLVVDKTAKGRTMHTTTGLLKWGWVEETGEAYVRLDPDGAAMFRSLAYQPWKVRLALKTDAAARLLSYVCSHKATAPHRVLLDDLRRWCGYHGRLRDWRAVCRSGLAELEARRILAPGSVALARGGNGEVVSWIRSAAAVDCAYDDEPKALVGPDRIA
jgi:hypothetical protein